MNWKKEKIFIESYILTNQFFIDRLIEKKKDYDTEVDYNFRCPICGDSKKSFKKKRGHIFWKYNEYENEGTFDYYCFNCGASLSFSVFLSYLKKRGLIDLKTEYDRYKFHLMGMKESELPKTQKDHSVDIKKIYELNDIYKSFFTPMKENPQILKYVEKRKIPQIYYDTKIFAWSGTLQQLINKSKLLKSNYNPNNYVRTNFLVFPSESIINNQLMVTGFNLRFLNDNYQPKYLKIELDIEMNPIKFFTNQFDLNIDNEYIIVVEGEIDSLMFRKIPTIAIKSSALKRVNKIEELNDKTFVYCWDNEYKTNKQIKMMIDKLNKNDYSVVWDVDRNNIYKDPNEMIVNGYVKDMDEYIKGKIFSGLKRNLLLKKLI